MGLRQNQHDNSERNVKVYAEKAEVDPVQESFLMALAERSSVFMWPCKR